MQGAEPSSEEAARLAESETWQSDDLDLSVHPEDLSSVQEWTERMQQKQTSGHEIVAPEDAESRLLTDGDRMERIEETPKVEGLSYYSPAAGSKILLTSISHPTPTSLDPHSSSDDHAVTRQTTETVYYSEIQPQQPSDMAEDVVEETIQSYSDRKKFWEQMTSQGSKQVVEGTKEVVTRRVLKTSASQEAPITTSVVTPVPRPRSMVTTTSVITKPIETVSVTSEIVESDTETGTQSDSTIRMRLFADAGQSTFTGSDISDQEVELDSGSTIKETTTLAIKSLSRDSQAESSDSEAEYLAKRGGAPMAFDNRGFVGVDKIDKREIELSSDVSEDVKPDEPTPLPTLIPSAAPRRIYERSVSLPSETSTPPGSSGFGGGVRAKKQFFEAQIKKEMAVEQLMTQPEEEPSPEHKAIFHQDIAMDEQGQTKPVARLRRASEGHPVSQIPGSLTQTVIETVTESAFEIKEDISIPEDESLPYDKEHTEIIPEETSVKSIIGVFEKKIVKTSVETPSTHEDEFSVHTDKIDYKSVRHESDDTKSTEIDLSISQTSGGPEEIQEKGEVEKAEKYLSAPPSEEEMSKSVEDNAYTVSELDISEGPVSEIIEDAATSLSTSRLISETDISSETKIHADVEEHREKDEVKLDTDLLHDHEKEEMRESSRDIGIMETKDVLSSRVAEMLQYKTEVISRPSDSLEVHVDKSEIEGTEKEREIEEDIEEFERVRVEEEGKEDTEKGDDELEKADQMKRSSEACDLSLQDDETEKEDACMMERESKGKDIYVSKQQLPDTVWEVPVQESSESMAVEVATDIPIEKQVIVEKEEDEEDLKCAKQSEVYRTEEAKSIKEPKSIEMTEEEAQIIAKEVVDEIEVKVAERTELIRKIPEQGFVELENVVKVEFVCPEPQRSEYKREVSDYLPTTSKSEKTDVHPEESKDYYQSDLLKSVTSKHHKKESPSFSRGDTASSMEIVDEDLRSSAGEAELSPVDRLQATIISAKEEKEGLVDHEKEEVEVVKKTLAEVRESLEAAQEELLEQHKKRKDDEKHSDEDEITSKKKSPSEFEFKVLDFQKTQNKFEDSKEEILHEDTAGMTEYMVDGVPVRTQIQLEQKEILKSSVKEVTEEERKLLGEQEDGKELVKEEHIKKFKDHSEGNVKLWESSAKEQSISGEGKAISMSNVEAMVVGEEEKKHTTTHMEDQIHLPDSVSHETTSVERDVVEGNLQKNQIEEARKEIEDETHGIKKKLVEEVKLTKSEVVSRKEETEEFSSEKEKSKLSDDSEESVFVKSEETRRQTLVKETKEDRVVKECSKTMTISEQKVVQFDGSTSPSRDLSREFRKDYEDKKRQFKVEMEQSSYTGIPLSGDVFMEETTSTIVEKPIDSSVVIVKKAKGISENFEVSSLDTFATTEKLESSTEPGELLSLVSSDIITIKKAKQLEEETSGLVSSEDEAKIKSCDSSTIAKETKMFDEESVGRTSSEDEAGSAFKSPPRIEESSSSSSIAGKRVMGLIGESEMVRLERPDGSETTVVLRRSRPDKRSDAESSGSGGTFKGSERRSGADVEGWSSSGESHYQSFEQTSDSGRTFSRPCSSDFEGLIGIGSGIGIGHGTTGSSEYETALSASADYSGRSGGTTSSQDYRTAVSSLSSRESMKSLDSESSGHLASIEVSSEASETLVPSALELERDMEGVTGTNTLMEDEETATSTTRAPTAVECKVLEPYDTEIPVHVIKGESQATSESRASGGLFQGHESISLEEDEGSGSGAEGPIAECPPSPFEIISESEVAEYPGEVSEPDDEEAELPEHEEAEDSGFALGGAMVDSRSRMKRSSEMTFHPEPWTITTDSPHSDTPVSTAVAFTVSSFSLDEGQTASSLSMTSSFGTVVEAHKHSGDSDRMDASITSDQISGSIVSEHLSIEESDTGVKSSLEERVLSVEKETMDSGTSTGLPMKGTPSSVTITTSSVESELGVQSVCTQVTSEVQVITSEPSPAELPQDTDDEQSGSFPQEKGEEEASGKGGTGTLEEFKGRNGPTEVDYTPEYDDFEESKKKTPRELGHRRKESTSFVPSMIPRPIRGKPKDSSFPASKKPSVEADKGKGEEFPESEKCQESSAEKYFEHTHVASSKKTYHKKDHPESEIDDIFGVEESYQTEADQGFHRDVREGRIASVGSEEPRTRITSLAGPSFEVGEEEDAEAELKELVESRPQSTAESLVSKSDSEGGHRPYSSEMGFSDDRPDSELTELLKQFSDGSGKDLLEEGDEGRDEMEDPIERPKSPEPPIDYSEDLIVKEEEEEISSETQTSVAELTSEYASTFKRDSITELIEQKIEKESIPGLAKALEKTSSRPTSPTSPTHPFSPEEDEMAEAEAAFQMVPRITPTLPSTRPDTILETEEETAEKLLLDAHKRPVPKVVAVVSATDIPDITVTEHLTPNAKDEFTYPEIASMEAADAAEITDDVDIVGKTSTPQTPASISSHASERSSENTDTDQGQEYVLGEEISADGDAIFEEPEEPEELTSSVASIVAVPVPGRLDGECTGGKFNADLHEVKEIPSSTSLPGSPTSDSFEMIEKSELQGTEAAAYVYVEEVSREYEKDLQFIKHATEKEEEFEEDDGIEDLLVSSPPPPTTRMTQIRYYPVDQSLEGHQKEAYARIPEGQPCHEFMEGDPESLYAYEMSFERAGAPGGYGVEVEAEYDREVEAGKKWIEMQFQSEITSSPNVGIIPGMPGYGYEMDFERGGPLEDIEERREEEEQNDGTASSSKVGSLGSCKESLSSTPEYDVLAGRKFFTRSGEHDDVSMSSLQEFERLEREIVTSGSAGSVGSTGSDPRRTSLGSQDSLNGAAVGRRPPGSRNGQGDDISLSSLQEFERLESACIEAAKVECRARQEEALLSEIEEGHESQVSESESCETISETGGGNAEDVAGNNSDSDDYEKRMFEIDEIIRQAQSNVEQFEKEASSRDDLHRVVGAAKDSPDTFSKPHARRGKSVIPDSEHIRMKTEKQVKKSIDFADEEYSRKEYSDAHELDLDASYSQVIEQEIDSDDIHHHLPHVAEVAAAAAAALATATVAPHAHHAVASRTISAGSAHSTTTQFDVESLKERRIEDYDDEDSLMEGEVAMTDDLMQGSTDSIEPKTVISDRIPVRHHDPLQTSTDSLDLRTTRSGDTMTTSADSIEFQAMATSGTMVASTDSLELDQQSMLKSFGAEEYRDTMTTSVDSIEEEASHVVVPSRGPPIQDHSSSSGQEGDLSSSGKEEDSGGIGLPAPMGGRPFRGSDPPEDPQRDMMVCSTDSLEPSSSTATHATYQYETDSVMSSSFTSGGSATMVSSTDTLDPEAMAAAAASLVSRGPQSPTYVASATLSSVLFDESYQGDSSSFIREGDVLGSEDSAIGFTADVKGGGTAYVTEVIEPVPEGEGGEASGFSHIVHRTVRLPPTIQHITFSGPDAEEQLRSYVKQFAPGEEEHESEETDKHGNVHVTRVVQKRIVLGAEEFVSGVSDPHLMKEAGDGAVVSYATSSKSESSAHGRGDSEGTCKSVAEDVDSTQLTQKTEVTYMTIGHDIQPPSSSPVPIPPPSQDPSETLYPSRPGLTSYLAGETGGVEHMIQEDATATFSTTMRGSEFYQMQDPEATSEYISGQPTTQTRVVSTRTHTRTVMGEDGRPVTVTTTETEVGDASGAEGVLDNNQLRESMQQIIDQFAASEESKEGRGKKEEKPE